MTTLREAAQQALEVLVRASSYYDTYAEIAALEAALAEPDPFNPDWDRIAPLQENLREHMAEIQRLRSELALQRFTDVNQEIEAALAEPVEPVAWRYSVQPQVLGAACWAFSDTKDVPDAQPLYTSPPQRKPEINSDYERGFVDGMSEQARRSVDRAVNAMVSSKAKPLTGQEYADIYEQCADWDDFARAVGRAHGIK